MTIREPSKLCLGLLRLAVNIDAAGGNYMGLYFCLLPHSYGLNDTVWTVFFLDPHGAFSLTLKGS